MSKKHNTSTPKVEIDVAVLTAGRFDLLAKCLDSIYREAQLIPLNIHILDNGSDAKERQLHPELFVYQKDKDPLGNVKDFQVKRMASFLHFPAHPLSKQHITLCCCNGSEWLSIELFFIIYTFEFLLNFCA